MPTEQELNMIAGISSSPFSGTNSVIREEDKFKTSSVTGITDDSGSAPTKENVATNQLQSSATGTTTPKTDAAMPVADVNLEIPTMPKIETVQKAAVAQPVSFEEPKAAKQETYEAKPFQGTRGIDTKELERLAKERLEQEQARIQEQATVELQNIKNLFSHLTATGKDSGFINSTNLAAARSAAKAAGDEMFRYRTNFNNEMYNIAKMKAEQEAGFNEQAYTNWISGNNDQLLKMAEAGDFDGVSELAGQLAELDTGNNFIQWQNPKFIESFKKRFDVNARSDFNNTMRNVDQYAANADLNSPTSLNRAIDTIIANVSSSELGNLEITNTINSVDEAEWDALGISEDNKNILREFKEGKRDYDDVDLQRAYADLYIREFHDELKRKTTEEQFGNVPDYITNDPILSGIYEALINDTAGVVNINNEDLASELGVNQFSVFGKRVDFVNDPDAISMIPGLDIYFADFNGMPYVGGYTKEIADAQPIEGLPQNQGYYSNIYKDYIKKKGAEYENLTSDLARETFEVMNFKQFINNIKESKGISTDSTEKDILEQSMGGIVDGKIAGIPLSEFESDPRSLDKYRDEFIDVLKSENINELGLTPNELKGMLTELSSKDDWYANQGVMDLIDQGKITVIPDINKEGWNTFDTNPDHPLHGEKGEAYIKSIGRDGKGYIAIDGEIHSVKAIPERYKNGNGNWVPIIVYEIAPLSNPTNKYYSRNQYSEALRQGTFGRTNLAVDDKNLAGRDTQTMFNKIFGD